MRKEVTEEQANAAKRLKAEFLREKNRNKTNYDEIGAKLDIGASAVSHYLNGNVAINMPFLLKFCGLFPDIDPVKIYPEMFEGIEFPTPSDPENVLREFYALPEDVRPLILSMIQSQSKKGG